jgi:hypothetical protein
VGEEVAAVAVLASLGGDGQGCEGAFCGCYCGDSWWRGLGGWGGESKDWGEEERGEEEEVLHLEVSEFELKRMDGILDSVESLIETEMRQEIRRVYILPLKPYTKRALHYTLLNFQPPRQCPSIFSGAASIDKIFFLHFLSNNQPSCPLHTI